MKETTLNNYSWLDIIEPTILEPSGFTWEYYLIIPLVIIGGILLNRYFKLGLRINFWFLLFKLKQDGDTRLFSKKLLKLLYLEKNIKYAAKYLSALDSIAINECRTDLLGACYSKKLASAEKIQSTLDKFSKSL